MKRFFSWVVILALVLSGCVGGSSTAEQQSSGGGTTDTAVQTTEDTSDSETVLVNLVTLIYGNDYKVTYTYDSSGNTTSAVYAYTYSDYTATYYYTYDETGRIICSISSMPSGYGWTNTYNYTNDSQGNLLTYSTEIEQGYIDGEIYSYYYAYYEFSYNEDNELETFSAYSSREEGGTLTLNGIGTYRYHYLDNGLLDSVDGYDEDGEREEDLFYFEYEAAVLLPADEAEAVQEAQTDRIRAFLRGEVS